MKLTADQVYQKLLEDFKIYEVQGQIKFYLGDVDIIVKARDVVGNIMQEWLEGWLKKNDIEYSPNENTQMPPDVFLNPEDKTIRITDNGLGMTADEVEEYINQVAFSGATDFVEKYKKGEELSLPLMSVITLLTIFGFLHR